MKTILYDDDRNEDLEASSHYNQKMIILQMVKKS
jgi:hypothetical protein